MDRLSKEIIKIKTDSEKYAVNKTKELLKVYKRNLNDVKNQISKIYMKYILDGELNISSKQRYSVLLQFEKQLAEQLKELGQSNIEITTNTLKDVCNETYYKTAYNIDKGIGFATSFALLKPEMVEAIINRPIEGKMFSKRIWDNTNKLAKRVRLDIEKAIIQGQSVEKLARQIEKDFSSSAYQAKRLINTETAKTVSLAQDEIYKSSDVIEKIMWNATLEGNTCSECAALDGKKWAKNENHPIPSIHPNCRCCLIPVVNGYEPTKRTVKNADGTYTDIPYMNYNKWKETRF
jgi:SPP1 gp7 family putative phage head morphogenesis protein